MARTSEMDLKDYWRILMRRKWWILGTMATATAFAVALNILTVPVYQATARIQVLREPTRSVLTGEMLENPTSQSDNLALYTAAELITNRKLMARVVGTLRAEGVMTGDERPGGSSIDLGRLFSRKTRLGTRAVATGGDGAGIESDSPGQAPVNPQIDWLLSRISVEPVRDTRLVNIHVEHSSPRAAEHIANTVADQFVEFHSEQRSAGSTNLVAYLSAQLEDARRNLRDAERASDYSRVREQRVVVGEKLARVRAAASGGPLDLDQLPVRSTSLESLKKQLLESHTELAKARQVYRERHPKLVLLESENESIRNSIRSELQSTIGTLQREYDDLAARERSLGGSSVGVSPSLESDLANSRALYTTLLTKLKEAEMTGQARGPLVEVVEPAAASPKPIRPRKTLNLIVCLLAGLTVGTGLAFLREYLRRTIRTPQDVDDYLQLPVLGLIPKA